MTVFGTTFSHRHAAYLGLDPFETYKRILDIGFDYVRLCCYWEEIEPAKGNFDFTSTKKLIEMSEKAEQKIIVTLGMKAPRWPEFYIPKWLQGNKITEIENELLHYIDRTVNELKEYSCISYWQVENEPLDPSGPNNLSIPLDLLTKEIKTVQAIDQRSVMLTVWGNQLTKRKNFQKLLALVENIGIDIYYKVPQRNIFNKTVYKGPSDSDEQLKKEIALCHHLWITELQAEPWEEYQVVSIDRDTPSFDLNKMKNNIERAIQLKPQGILLWGSEYWFWQAEKGNERYLEFIKRLI